MKDPLENKLNMALATQLAMNNNTALWNTIPAMVTTMSSLGTTLASIQAVRSVQEQDIRGIAQDKEKNKQLAINAALTVIGGLKAFARANSNNTLLQKINYGRSEMEKARDTVLPDQLKIVKDEATANIAALANYNVTSTQVNALSGAIAAYEVMIPKPRAALNIKKNATESLDFYFRQIDQPLKIIDGLMETLKQTQPAFFKTYRNARIIVDTKNTGNSSKGGPGNPSAEPES